MKKLPLILVIVLLLGSLNGEKDYTQFILDLNSTIKNKNLGHYHYSYDQLAYVVDTYGPRLWGSSNLQLVIDYMYKQALSEGFDNVRLEPVKNFTKWVRGKQSLTLLSPRPVQTKLEVIGLGSSIAGEVKGQVIVIENWEELEARKKEVFGKIVLFNHPWVNYQTNIEYRVDGASKAASHGAIAMLVRSVTPSSIGSVHTGYMEYDQKFGKIPAAAITIEDADMFKRMQKRGQKIIVHLVLNNQFIANSRSNNLVFEIAGSTYPDQIVLAGGHIDSWDTGSQTGATDDGGGFMTVFAALRLLKSFGYRPKRTIRFIAWSGEESGSPVDGANQYLQAHRSQLNRHVVGFENDVGSTQLIGFGLTGDGQSVVKQILQKYMSLIGAGLFSDDGQCADTSPLYEQAGVPMMKNIVQDTQDSQFYFRYHHTAGDTMSIIDPDELDSNTLGIAGMLYILADLDKTLRDIPHSNLKKLTI